MPKQNQIDVRRCVSTTEEGYEALAAFVILQAVKDYQRALRKKDKMEIKTLERWFRGPEFGMWSESDPEYLIEKSRETVRRIQNRGRKKAVERIHPGDEVRGGL